MPHVRTGRGRKTRVTTRHMDCVGDGVIAHAQPNTEASGHAAANWWDTTDSLSARGLQRKGAHTFRFFESNFCAHTTPVIARTHVVDDAGRLLVGKLSGSATWVTKLPTRPHAPTVALTERLLDMRIANRWNLRQTSPFPPPRTAAPTKAPIILAICIIIVVVLQTWR
jgi:hypothetical protein